MPDPVASAAAQNLALPPAEPSPTRWAITFGFISVLLVVFGLVALLGLTHSDWLYGNYGEISAEQWLQIESLRDELVGLDASDQAVSLLDDALLVPHPATENVLLDLRKAALALDRCCDSAEVKSIQRQLYSLVAALEPGAGPIPTRMQAPTPIPTPNLTPIEGVPIARSTSGLERTST